MRYITRTLLHESPAVRVVAADRASDGLPVVIKQLASTNPTPAQRGRLKYEHSILQSLAHHRVPNVPRPVEIHEAQGEFALVVESMGGASVRQHGKLALGETLHVALQVCDALAGCHAHGITHKDITPDNIVLNRDTGQVQLIDFDIAASLAREAQPFGNVSTIEGTLAYVSPEQTGRTTCMLDHRSDFYSLGVTLYELLCGVLPFAHSRAGALVHAHLAEAPRHPCEHVPTLPPMLADIVMKLLSKAPEARYQSARGLRHDLQYVAEALRAGFLPIYTELASHDRDATFQVPDKIYGRDAEMAVLKQTFARVLHGEHHLLLVSGPSGIGKSALVHAIQPELAARDGIYVTGKHDLLRRHLPLSGLASVIDQVVHRMLLEPQARLALWQRRLQEALGRVGQALVHLVPSLELVVGVQPEAPTLGPQEAENRLMFLLDRVLRACCAEQPLVVFLDDLQWADAATLKFLSRWHNTVHDHAGLLLMGAYRDNEVSSDHPLHAALQTLQSAGVHATALQLGPMGEADLEAWVRDATHNPNAYALADLLLERTAGNPFFVRELLRELARAHQLQRKDSGEWTWDLHALQAAAFTQDVLAFMTQQLQRIAGPQEKPVLAVAACMGRRFTLHGVCEATDLTPQQVLAALQPALRRGLVLPAERAWRYAMAEGGDAAYMFVHDKVHEAALTLLDDLDAAPMHQRIGEYFLRRMGSFNGDENLFAALGHLNLVPHLLHPAMRSELATLNRHAAEEAQRATAYDIAMGHWEHAMALWQDSEPQLSRHATLQLANCEFLLARPGADQRLRTLLTQCTDPAERVEVTAMHARSLGATLRYAESVQTGLDALHLLGFNLSRRPHKGHVLWALLKLQAALRGRPMESLGTAAPIADPRILRALDILFDMTAPAYFTDVNMYGQIVLMMGQLTLQHGDSPHSAFVYASLTAVYASANNWPLAARYAQVANGCIDRMDGVYTAGRLAVDVCMDFTHKHARDIIRAFMESGVKGMAAGDLVNASNAISMAFTIGALCSCEDLQAEIRGISTLGTQLNRDFGQYSLYHRQMERAMRGATVRPGSYTDAEFDEEAEQARIQRGEIRGMAPTFFYQHRTFLSCIHRNFDEGLRDAQECIARGGLTKTGPHSAFLLDFFYGVIITQHAWEHGGRSKHFKHLRRTQKRFRRMAAVEPTLPRGASLLLDAEALALGKLPHRAAPLYEEATRLLTPTGYNAMTAVAHECAARYYLRQGIASAAQMHVHHAVRTYEILGANAKLRLLHHEFGEVTAAATHRASATGNITDLPAFMRASQALSGEVVTARLVQKIVDTTREIAGGTRAVLLQQADNGALVPHGDDAHVPQTVLQYVARSRKPMVCNDAMSDPRWLRDPYVQKYQPRSMLCMPLLYQGAMHGVLYMENSLTPRMFTHDRVQLVNLLAAQAAVSLNNARLVADLEHTVHVRTDALRQAHQRLLKVERQATEMHMAGGFAHEMRNALAGPGMTLSDMLQNGHGHENADPKLRLIHAGIQRSMQVTERILQYAEVAHMLPGTEVVNLHAAVQEAACTLDGDFAETGITLHNTVATDVCVVAKRAHIVTVLQHLLDNARDALRIAHGRPRTITVACTHAGQTLSLQVEDTGVGMDAGVRSRVFDPFFSTKGHSGTGLSLGMARNIAQLYGGDLQFTSQVGQGTTFCLTLPHAAPAAQRPISCLSGSRASQAPALPAAVAQNTRRPAGSEAAPVAAAEAPAASAD